MEDERLSLQDHPVDVWAGRPYDVLAVSGIDVDLVLKVDRLPDHGEKVMGQFVGWLPGGPAANYACAAARLGLQVASLSTVGTDQFGQLIIADFEEYGVATEHVLVRPEIETHFTVILIEPSGERSIVVVPMFKEQYDDDYLQQAISQTRAIHTMPNDPALFVQMAKIAHANDVLVMIDVEATIGADREILELILSHVDIASFNERGLVASSGEKPTVEGARSLLAYGPHTVAVTLGKRGALAVTAEEAAIVPGWQVPVQDTTGAGDTFNAAFLMATLRQYPLQRRLAFANAAAALAITGLGPRGRLPTRAEVEEFIASGIEPR